MQTASFNFGNVTNSAHWLCLDRRYRFALFICIFIRLTFSLFSYFFFFFISQSPCWIRPLHFIAILMFSRHFYRIWCVIILCRRSGYILTKYTGFDTCDPRAVRTQNNARIYSGKKTTNKKEFKRKEIFESGQNEQTSKLERCLARLTPA